MKTAIAVIILLFISSCAYQQETIKIGALLPLAGERADDAAAVKNGIDLAVKEVNQRNDLKATIRVIYEDSRCDAKTAENAAVELILANGVRAIIGDICPEATVAASRIAKSNNAILINLAPNITAHDYTITINGTTSPVFIKFYERVYNSTPNSYAAQGYQAVKVLAEALQETDYTGRKLSVWFNSLT